MSRRHPNVANLDEVEPVEGPRAGAFRAEMRPLGRAAGNRALGCTHYTVEPGAHAFPHHFHTANEEAVLVLEGTGTLRLGAEEVPVRAGDWIALTTGADHAHQLRNTGAVPLRYVCVSTMVYPEVCGYPDSKKLGLIHRDPAHPLRAVFFEEDARGYFDREPEAG